VIYGAIDPVVVTAIVAALLGGGWLGGLAIFRKAGPEAKQVVADTLIQVNQHLREELERRDKDWQTQIDRRDKEINHLRDEVKRLRNRLSEVQDDLQRVETELTEIGQSTRVPAPPS
jgi:peptidoglycan hydrolase CwlO-like protein